MFKTRSTNQETIIAISLFLGILLMLVVNIGILAPLVWRVYENKQKTGIKQPIDVVTVNQAIELLNDSSK